MAEYHIQPHWSLDISGSATNDFAGIPETTKQVTGAKLKDADDLDQLEEALRASSSF